MLYTTAAYSFPRDGEGLGASELSWSWIDNMVGVDRDNSVYACGRENPRFMGADPACFALSLSAGKPRWRTTLSGAYKKFTGNIIAEGTICFASEDENPYQIAEVSPVDD
jgi:outer membrane protein assembly factor BamB